MSKSGWELLSGHELPTLAGVRVNLRTIDSSDVPTLFSIFSDPEVTRYWGTSTFRTIDDAHAYLQSIRAGAASRQLFQWGIAPVAAGHIIGTCTLFQIDPHRHRGTIGFALGRAHWGKGLASDAVTTAIRFAFEELELHRLEADPDPRNERSIRLLEKQGFQREGLLRERYEQDGELQDAVFLGLLRREWTGFR